jgi:hypothetical protein
VIVLGYETGAVAVAEASFVADPYPIAGTVRVHAADRKRFYQIMKETEPQPADSALVYVELPPRGPAGVLKVF